MRSIILTLCFFLVYNVAVAAVTVNEIQISPIGERFIELYNSGSSDVDLTGWYVQRKTAAGSNFSSLVTGPNFDGKSIKAGGYFLISRNQLGNSNIVIDNLTLTEFNTIRARDSKGKDVDQVEVGGIDDGKSYQRTLSGGWMIATPTPGAINATAQTASLENSRDTTDLSTAQASVDGASNTFESSQIIVDVGRQSRTALVGAPIVFEGRVLDPKNEHTGKKFGFIWNFNDGAPPVNGEVATHIYSEPGEYWATVQLDPAFGYSSELYRVRITVALPNIALHTGGDSVHSFITIENRAENEIDLSGWKVSSDGKIFTFYPNTLLVAHGTIKLASDKTGLSAPVGAFASLRFPDGTPVKLQSEITPAAPATPTSDESFKEKIISKPTVAPYPAIVSESVQKASVADIVSDISTPLVPTRKNGSMLPWYTGVAFLGAVALLGLRFARSKGTLADEFEIIEDED